jgi:hypothetical protein
MIVKGYTEPFYRRDFAIFLSLLMLILSMGRPCASSSFAVSRIIGTPANAGCFRRAEKQLRPQDPSPM